MPRFQDYSESESNALKPGFAWRTRAIITAHQDSPDWAAGVDDVLATWRLRIDPRRAGQTPTIDVIAEAASISGDGRTITVDFAATAAQTAEIEIAAASGRETLLVDLHHREDGEWYPYWPLAGTLLAIAGAGSL